MSRDSSSHWLADLSLLATTLMWGANLLVIKWIVRDHDPFVFNAVRMLLSGWMLGVCAGIELRVRKRDTAGESPSEPAGSGWLRGWTFRGFALLSGLLYPLTFMSGMQETTAGNTALLLSSMPMWTALLSALFLRERLPRITILGLLITTLGTAAIAAESGSVSASPEHLVGNLFILAAAVIWAAATVTSRPLLRQVSPLQLAFWSTFLTTPIHLMMNAAKLPEAVPRLLEWPTFGALLYSGLLSTGLAYVTWHYGVQAVGASHASAFQNVVTLVGVLGGWALFGEQITTTQWLGGLAIVYGLVLMRKGRAQSSGASAAGLATTATGERAAAGPATPTQAVAQEAESGP
jgi:drug/metabolite transporter (DMT)-like permease